MKTKVLSGLVIAAIVVVGLVYVKANISKSVTTSVPVRTAEDIRLGLPADPGYAGKKTLEGIDSDKDGVRDDIQRLIATEYSHSAKLRAALQQYASSLSAALISSDANVSTAWTRVMTASECVTYVSLQDAHDSMSLVKAETLNTRERSRTYLGMSSQTSSKWIEGREACEFNPDTLPN